MTRRQLNTFTIICVSFLLCLVTIGYSALQTTLTVSGDVEVLKNRDPVILPASYDSTYAFRDPAYKDKIKTITFSDQLNPPSGFIASWDVGVPQIGNVMAYIKNNATSGYYDLYIQGDGHLYANENSSFMFYQMTAVDQVNGLDKLDVSRVTDMSQMFWSLGENSQTFTLTIPNNWDTTKVTNMDRMFYWTGYNSTAFTLSLGTNFDTSNVTSMEMMFDSCGHESTVMTLNLGSKFNTSKVTDMMQMFCDTGYSSPVFTLTLGSNFNTANVTDMSSMFLKTGYNSTVFTFNLGSKFNTSNVTDMFQMFALTGGNSSSFTLNLGNYFDTSNVTNGLEVEILILH